MNFHQSFGKKNNPADGGVSHVLRREGDSNPRYGYPYGSLANCWFKPLTHRSKKRLPISCPIAVFYSLAIFISGAKI